MSGESIMEFDARTSAIGDMNKLRRKFTDLDGREWSSRETWMSIVAITSMANGPLTTWFDSANIDWGQVRDELAKLRKRGVCAGATTVTATEV